MFTVPIFLMFLALGCAFAAMLGGSIRYIALFPASFFFYLLAQLWPLVR